MRLIDADKLIEEWLDAENEPVYCANDVLSSIDEQPTVDAFEWITLTDDTKLEDGLYLVTTTDGRVDIAEFSNEPKLYEWGKKGICIGCASYWNIPDEILAVTPFEPYTKAGVVE